MMSKYKEMRGRCIVSDSQCAEVGPSPAVGCGGLQMCRASPSVQITCSCSKQRQQQTNLNALSVTRKELNFKQCER